MATPKSASSWAAVLQLRCHGVVLDESGQKLSKQMDLAHEVCSAVLASMRG